MYFLITSFAFLMAMCGARPAPLQKPREGLKRMGRDMVDFFLTASLILTLGALAAMLEETRAAAREFAVLGPAIAAYLLSRYQKKNDVFFLSVVVAVFMISSKTSGLLQGVFLAWVVSAGIALFQACFLGLRYKLLFSHLPASAKGWPSLCLLAGFISIVLWGFWSGAGFSKVFV